MSPKTVSLCLVLAATGLISGCATRTLESRIHEKSNVFARITPRQQAMIKQGMIGHGFSRDMVYMALDRPDRVVPGPGPQQETWIYLVLYPADGSNTHIPQKIVTHEKGNELPSSGHMRGAITGKTPLYQLTYTVEYDPNDARLATTTTTRVAVMFRFGRVASIQVDKV